MFAKRWIEFARTRQKWLSNVKVVSLSFMSQLLNMKGYFSESIIKTDATTTV
jgi:hypothetical protein